MWQIDVSIHWPCFIHINYFWETFSAVWCTSITACHSAVFMWGCLYRAKMSSAEGLKGKMLYFYCIDSTSSVWPCICSGWRVISVLPCNILCQLIDCLRGGPRNLTIIIWIFLQSDYHNLHSCNLTIIICIQCSREWVSVWPCYTDKCMSIVSAFVFSSLSLDIDWLRIGSLYQTQFGTTCSCTSFILIQ